MRDVLRYMGVKKETDEYDAIIAEETAVADKIVPRFTYAFFNTENTESGIKLAGTDIVLGGKLAGKHFSGCRGVIVFLATLTLGSEIALKRAFAENAAKAVVLDAVFTDKLEKYLDGLEEIFKEKYDITTRISCGYGDLPIELEKPLLFAVGGDRIGVSVNGSYMLTPNKSVIAIAGVK